MIPVRAQEGWRQILLFESVCVAVVAVLCILGLLPKPFVLPARFAFAPDARSDLLEPFRKYGVRIYMCR